MEEAMAKRMTVVFDDEALYTAIKVEAARRHVPAKDLIAEALELWFERLEDEEDLRIAKERLATIDEDGTLTQDEMRERLGMPRRERV